MRATKPQLLLLSGLVLVSLSGALSCRADAPAPDEIVSRWLTDLWTRHSSLLLALSSAFVVLVVYSLKIRSSRRLQIRRNEALIQRGDFDIGSVGSLLAMLYSPSPHHRAIAATTLIQVLPSLEAEDAVLLEPQSRTFLYRALSDSDPYLVFAVLEALAKIGTAEAIPHVEAMKRKGANQQTIDAIEQCLEILRVRAEEQRRGQELLRASTTPTAPIETLLRPVRETETLEAQQLLRADSETPRYQP